MSNLLPSKEPYPENAPPNIDRTDASIREQVLWASFFPLALFGILSVLVITNVFYRLSLDLVSQRNSAQAQTLALFIERDLRDGSSLSSVDLHEKLTDAGISNIDRVYLLSTQGTILNQWDGSEGKALINPAKLLSYTGSLQPTSRLVQPSSQTDEIVISTAPIQGAEGLVVLIEPWAGIMAPVANYEILLSGITVLGVALSLLMLYLAVNRISRPISMLTTHANQAIPGSVFRPMREFGPSEIRNLIHAFNKMVIRLAEQQSALRKLAHKSLMGQEEERQRISHELHDGTLQDLVGLSQRVELCRNELDVDAELARKRLTEIQGLLNHTLNDVRNISMALRPPLLEELGLDVAVQSLCQKMNESKVGLQCEYGVTGKPRRLDADLELAAYRVVQEALSNIRKHAPEASMVKVELSFGNRDIRVTIRNNGGGFSSQDMQEYVRKGHIGLAGMYERARFFGGHLTIKSKPSENTVVVLQLPYLTESEAV